MEFEFEFDPDKSAVNKAKHGIDFVEAQELWKDGQGLTTDTKFVSEERFAITAKFNGKIWTAIFTLRDVSIRIISARRARDYEVDYYENNIG